MEVCRDNSNHDNVDGHVHFADGVQAHNLIQVQQQGDNEVHVHVGFLQTNHKYEIKFDIPNLANGNGFSAQPKVSKNVQLEVIEIQPTDASSSQLHIIIHLFVSKEGLTKSCFTLRDETEKTFDVVIHARVLGKYSGTPMVKDGIHCLEVLREEDSTSELT